MEISDRRPVLVALSGSASPSGAIAAGLELARAGKGPLHFLHVDIYPDEEQSWAGARRLDPRHDSALQEACRRAEARGLEAGRERVFGHPPEEIARVAGEIDAWLVVVGSTRRPVLATASVPRLLTKICRQPVLVVPAEHDRPLTRLLVPTDGSPGSRRAVEHAVDVAALLGGEVVALGVVKLSDPRAPVRARRTLAYRLEPSPGDVPLAEAEAQARAAGVSFSAELVACDSVHRALVNAIERMHPGLVVVPGPGNGRRLRFGRSLHSRLLGRSACPSLVVPADARRVLHVPARSDLVAA